ncbi:MAG: acyl-CoA/acyl-ACP dehydrogenase [Candidatus Binataceae bacterium]|nr:acyl-CoA/acyl-ACP dehydrogenase [Candidatus Binataceae bacterium]
MGKILNNFAISGNLSSRAEAVAVVAAETADAVDREARFPAETFLAARANRLLGMLVPRELGGDGASVSDVVDVCYLLGRACASSGMIFAMHQIMVAILVIHARGSAWQQRLLRQLCKEQLLLASSTTEGQGGGDLRKSACALEQTSSRIALTKTATVISYGAQADAILTTARRSGEALPSDQVLVVFLKDDYHLEPIMDWETLGMRGTCSAGFTLRARGGIDQVLPEPYQRIHTHTMMPVAHLTWSAVWAGLAAGSVERARRFVRAAARGAGGQPPSGTAHLTRAAMSLRSLRALLASALQRFEDAADQAEKLESLDFQNAMNLLKVNASESAIATVMSAMQVCGLAGYRSAGEFSLARYIRDSLSSSIMINNDRILANVAPASFLIEVPNWLRG